MDVSSTTSPPVGLYVHIPFCERKCVYCSFYSEPISQHNPYPLIEALIQELDFYPELSQVRTVYIGGGSPTCLPPALLEMLLTAIRQRGVNPQEWTVECNPGQLSADFLERLWKLGVNRISLGVQSFNDRELLFLGRQHNAQQACLAIDLAQQLGFQNVGIDLIYALPMAHSDTWQHSLQEAISLGVSHISTYSLSFESGTPLDQMRKTGKLQPVDDQTDGEQYQQAIDALEAAGYQHYEISNFARPGYACQHNLGYWHNQPFIGIGPGASSSFEGRRTRNLSSLLAYKTQINRGQHPWAEIDIPTKSDHLCETAVLNLRTHRGIRIPEFSQTTGTDLFQAFGALIKHHQQNGWLQVSGDSVQLTPAARPVADSILCDFASL